MPRNLGQGARFNDSKYFVIEGDEYDTAFFDKRSKFIHYLPELLVINNIEFDHADIFDDLDAIKLSFRRLLNIVPQNGMVLLNGDDPNCVEVAQDCLAPIVEVGFSENAREQIRDVSYGVTRIPVHSGGNSIRASTHRGIQRAQRSDGVSCGALLRPQPGSDPDRAHRVSKASSAGRKCAARCAASR